MSLLPQPQPQKQIPQANVKQEQENSELYELEGQLEYDPNFMGPKGFSGDFLSDPH